jgi:hypothetical protein
MNGTLTIVMTQLIYLRMFQPRAFSLATGEQPVELC